jgi:hypothetical protein
MNEFVYATSARIGAAGVSIRNNCNISRMGGILDRGTVGKPPRIQWRGIDP